MMQYEYSAVQDLWLQQAMLAKDKRKYLPEWQNRYETSDRTLNFKQFSFTPDISDLEHLPSLSFMLRVLFKLQKPYLSKDDRAFHLLDHPVRKDKVFQTPMVASTSWKGALNMAMMQQLAEWWSGLDETARNDRRPKKEFIARRISLGRLFGTEKGFQIDNQKFESYLDSFGGDYLARWYRRYTRCCISSTGFFSGRLYFYPTFFDNIDKKKQLEVINPHDRKKGTSARGPIYIECVPKDATGDFVILYVPFGKIDESQVAKDLELVAKGVEAMLTVYGFGAKTSSGFGIVEQQGVGQIAIKSPYFPQRSQRPQEPKYPEKLRLFLEQYPDEDFQLKPDEWRKLKQASQPQRKSYQEARKVRSAYQVELGTYESGLAKWETEANAPPIPRRTENFDTLIEMVSKAQEIAEQLNDGGQEA